MTALVAHPVATNATMSTMVRFITSSLVTLYGCFDDGNHSVTVVMINVGKHVQNSPTAA
jgi:hypothetical protein